MPRRFLAEGLPVGAARDATLPRERLRAMIAAYYAIRGWDAAGNVPATMVEQFQLDDLAAGEV